MGAEDDDSELLDGLYAAVLDGPSGSVPDVAPASPETRHVSLALRIRRTTMQAERELAGIGTIVDWLPFGVALLDAAGRATFLSRAAQEIVSRADGLVLDHGCIRAAAPDDDLRLLGMVRQALGLRDGSGARDEPLLIRRTGGLPPLVVAVARPRRKGARPIAGVCFMMIYDPESTVQPPAAAVRDALGLTMAEARLASLLSTGITLREAATKLGLSINTCKSQLKAIYAKTGCDTHVGLAMSVLQSVLFARPGVGSVLAECAAERANDGRREIAEETLLAGDDVHLGRHAGN